VVCFKIGLAFFLFICDFSMVWLQIFYFKIPVVIFLKLSIVLILNFFNSSFSDQMHSAGKFIFCCVLLERLAVGVSDPVQLENKQSFIRALIRL